MSLLYTLLAALLATGFMSPCFAGGISINLVQKGCKQMDSGNYADAVSTLVVAVRQNPSDLETRRKLCTALVGAGRATDALRELQVITRFAPGDARDSQLMAEAYYLCGDAISAITKYREALALNPDAAEAKLGLIRSLISTGNPTEAKGICQQTLRSSRDAVLRKQVAEILQGIRFRSSFASIEELKG